MKRNIYNLKLRGTGDEETGGIGIGGVGIGIGGVGIGIDEGGGPSGDIIPDGYQLYNVQLDRILYYLTCSGGEHLQSVNSFDLRAYNVE